MSTLLSTLRHPRALALSLVLLASSGFFARFLHQHFEVQHWLFWRFATYWLATLGWLLSCTMLGYELMGRLFGATLRKSEQLTFGVAVGVLAFGLAIFFLGLVHCLNVVTFFALPIAFAAGGYRRARSDFARYRARTWRGRLPAFGFWTLPVTALATLALGVLYFQILSPETFSFDVRWYHIPMAQRYALSGSVGPFAEGFWPGAFPHLLSYLYAWAFLAPGTLLFDRVELCAHIEFVLFLATLAQIPVLVRRLAPRAPAALTWVTLLMFPGIYIYDLNLHAGADHATGFWAIPIALAFWRAWRTFNTPNCALFAMMVGAAFLTKYTSIPIVLGPSVALVGRGFWVAAKQRDATSLRALGCLLILPLVVSAPHWLKNWVWYGDPVYPMLAKYLSVHPNLPELSSRLAVLEGTGRPGSLTPEGLLKAAEATLTFSFIPNNWEFLYGRWPVFGSLFTLTLPCLPFLRGARRLVWLYLLTLVAVFLWYLISHYDRYLQAVVPWMAGATAVSFALIWVAGWLARAALLALVCVQLAWGGDAPFIRTHNQVGDSAFRHVALFLASAYEGKPNRLRIYEPLGSIGKTLPRDAVLLAHDEIMILGIDRNWVTDLHQSLIHYGRLGSPAAIDDQLKALGVTHLMWPEWSINRDSLGEDLAFLNYAINHTLDQQKMAGRTIARLPPTRPAATQTDYEVALLGCGRPYQSGIYRLSQLNLPVVSPGPAPEPVRQLESVNAAATTAQFVVIDTQCHPDTVPDGFVRGSVRGSNHLYVRTQPQP